MQSPAHALDVNAGDENLYPTRPPRIGWDQPEMM
jgi:hypothetical protein